MAFISITRLRVRSWRFLPSFLLGAVQSSSQAGKAPGNLALEVLRDRKNTFWTASTWENESAMREYIRSGPHGRVMKQLMEWCDEASVVHWTQDSPALPSWTEAYRRMQQEGRRSKVQHPSAAQTAYEIPEPLVRPRQARRFK